MRPENLNTKIYLDGGDPEETKQTLGLLGFLDGQTTNPSLVAKNPDVKARLDAGNKFEKQELLDFYKKMVGEASARVPEGSISIEVYADDNTTSEEMIAQARDMYTWVDNAHIKLPTTTEGLKAAEVLAAEGMRLNLTLIFSQEQAAAVYAATKGAKQDIYVSPFDGRLDDIGVCGMCTIENIQKMFKDSDGHVKVLAASIRDLEHLLHIIQEQVDIITAPFKILKEWGEQKLPMPDGTIGHIDHEKGLEPVPFKGLDIDADWKAFDLQHELTAKGLKKFTKDWNNLLK